VYSVDFSQFITEAFKARSFSKKRKFLEKQVEDPGRQVSPAARKKKQKTVPGGE